MMIRPDELIVDHFAGGGGASTGIFMALGRHPDIAINHDPEAIGCHTVNHPGTRHFCEDIWNVDPEDACGGRPVGLLWASPNCQHYSRARGGKPVDRKIRALAHVVVRWARTVRPRVIVVENVREFAEWSRLDANGRPHPKFKGETFRKWVRALEKEGYEVQMRELQGCDYGAPTSRSRLFVVARCDGAPIEWPAPTHGRAANLRPYRTAADCIDWSLPCPSIFERKKPLSEATMRRIARGVQKFVLDSASPFLIHATHQGAERVHSIEEPLPTVTCANRGEMGVVIPRFELVGDEAPDQAVVPFLIQTSYGERKGQAPRILDIHEPLGTVVAGGQKHAVVAAFLTKNYGGKVGPGSKLTEPMHTITTQDHNSLVEVALEPAQLGGNRDFVAAFLLKYFRTGCGIDPREPLHTITTKERFGLVVVRGVEYRIVDIGFRMLTPRELFRAQGFPETYEFRRSFDQILTKTAQVRLVGNSVCPPVASAVVAAQFGTRRARIAA
jgi:DNA (cytosine-5)-methyltransferase 1